MLWEHDVTDDVISKRNAHSTTDIAGVAEMDAGPNPGLFDLRRGIGKPREGPGKRREPWGTERELILVTQLVRKNAHECAGCNRMRRWIFLVPRREHQRAPGWVGVGQWIAVCVSQANRMIRAPEIIGVFSVKNRNKPVAARDGQQRQQPSIINQFGIGR